MSNNNLRKNLIELLHGGAAHHTLEDILTEVEKEKKMSHLRPRGFEHSIWEVQEHMRLVQEDLLQYTINPNWQSPPFPDGYWPKNDTVEGDWDKTIKKISSDLKQVIGLVEDENLNLTGEIPHGEGRTYLREILLIADHNSYHLGQIMQIKKW